MVFWVACHLLGVSADSYMWIGHALLHGAVYRRVSSRVLPFTGAGCGIPFGTLMFIDFTGIWHGWVSVAQVAAHRIFEES